MRPGRRTTNVLLAVGFIVGVGGIVLSLAGNQSGVPSEVWSLKGNRSTHPDSDFLGTSDNQPIVIKTNSSPALTLRADGTSEVHNALLVHGDATFDKNVSVGGSLGATGDIKFTGSLQLGGDLAVAGQAQFAKDAHILGALTADRVTVAGTTRTEVLEITGGDLAEPFSIHSGRRVGPGDVLVIDDQHPGQLTVSDTPYDRRVAGVVSGAGNIAPGVIMYREGSSQGAQHVALAGRVYANADTTNGAISPGDLLTTSGVPGYVMKVTDYHRAQGAIVGKAISALPQGHGLVLILVSLQ